MLFTELAHAIHPHLMKAEEIHPSIVFSKEFLAAYTHLDRRIHKLEDENEAFDTRNTLQNEKKQASDRLSGTVTNFKGMLMNKRSSGENGAERILQNENPI